MNILMAQPNYQVGPKHLNSYYLPYSIGCIWSYAQQFEDIKDNYLVIDWLFKRDNINEVISKHNKIDVVFCSVYVWNEKYCEKLSRCIRSKWPDCVIIWGGPQVNYSDTNIFKRYDFLNIISVSEGEITTLEILRAILRGEETKYIEGTVYNDKGTPIRNALRSRTSIENFPSPYISDVFSHIIKQHPEIQWSAVLETNRGCPYSCTYCDWGSLTASKIKNFSMEKIKKELEWFKQNNIRWLAIADANFGIHKHRDLEIARLIKKINDKHSLLEGVSINTLKNRTEDVIEISKILGNLHYNGISLPFQSMNKNTLKAVKRSNMALNAHRELIEKIHKEKLKYYVEMILPLPLETKDSWRRGFYELYETGIHDGINAYSLYACVNTELTQTQILEYDMDITLMPIMEDEEEYIEYAPIVTATNTMTYEEYIECLLFSKTQTILHSMGYSQLASIRANEQGVGFQKFYEKLEEILNRYNEWNLEENKLKNLIKQSFSKNPKISIHDIDRQNYIRAQLLRTVIMDAVEQTLNHFGISDSIDIMKETNCIVYNVQNKETWPIEYKGKTYRYTGTYCDNILEYADILTFRRNKNFIKIEISAKEL